VAWRLVTPNPEQLPTLTRWESLLARMVHGVLLLAMAVIPVFGYLFATALGDEISIYDVFEIPSLMELNKAQSELVITIHVVLAYSIGVLIALHILATLKHHFVDKNEVLRRMWR
jgi:cytochrome b561